METPLVAPKLDRTISWQQNLVDEMTKTRELPTAEDGELPRRLTALELTLLGIGACIGAGIFVLTGAEARIAGPSVAVSFLLAGMSSIFNGLCFAELATRLPVSGSSYLYVYCMFGELPALMLVINQLVDYHIGAATLSRSLVAYLAEALREMNVEVGDCFSGCQPFESDVVSCHLHCFPRSRNQCCGNFGCDCRSAKCPCVGLAGLDGTTTVKLDANTSVDYPGSFAAYCRAWDNGRHNVSCKEGQEPGKDKGWCAESWCYVDPCNCELDEPATKVPDDGGYMPHASYQGRGMWYSYKTCGGKDYWMTPEKKKELQAVPKNCSKKVDEKKWGDEKCRCIGYDGAPGSANVSIGGKEVPYPAETGASCSAWDEKNHPDCQGAKPAAWCKKAWCYVDPCECSLVVPPKTSAYLPKGVGNGKPIYFSYAACGADDEYTAGNEEACVNQVETNCSKLEKCAWDGKQCLGKELVQLCSSAQSWASGFAVVIAAFVWLLM